MLKSVGSLGHRDVVLTQVSALTSVKSQYSGQRGSSTCEDSALRSCACLLGASRQLASQLCPCKRRGRGTPLFPHTAGRPPS